MDTPQRMVTITSTVVMTTTMRPPVLPFLRWEVKGPAAKTTSLNLLACILPLVLVRFPTTKCHLD